MKKKLICLREETCNILEEWSKQSGISQSTIADAAIRKFIETGGTINITKTVTIEPYNNK